MKQFLAIVLCLLAATATLADFERGEAAFEDGDYQTARTEWLPIAEAGDAPAQYRLGLLYGMRRSGFRDDAVAADWLLRSAKQGHAAAQFQIGVMYDQGLGVRRDFGEAASWYRKAADQGLAEAQFNLGIMYSVGEGVEKSDAEYARWTRLAAEQGVAKAQYNLGLRYRRGRGVPQDNALALMWLGLAASQGHEPGRMEAARLADKMPAEDIERAQEMGRDWKPRPGLTPQEFDATDE